MIELTKGGNVAVEAATPRVSIRWRASDPSLSEMDVSAFVLREDGRVSGDADMIFYGQPVGAGGAVCLEQAGRPTGDGGFETTLLVRLTDLPPEVERVAVSGSLSVDPAASLTFGRVEELDVAVLHGDSAACRFRVPVGGASETALILGEFYRRNGAWKFRAIGQGFTGGLAPLARHFGVVIAEDAPSDAAPAPIPLPAPAPPPAPLPAPIRTVPPVSLAKITLSKTQPSIDLTKRADGFGEIRINLNWTRPANRGGLFGRMAKGVDLDVGCLYQLQNGEKGTVQALGNAFGAYDKSPYVALSGDDRTGAAADGEWIRINGRRWSDIRRVLLYAYIYEGAPNWAATDGIATVYVPASSPIEVRLDDGRPLSTCAIALIENTNGTMRISRQIGYFNGQSEMSKAFRWGLTWKAGSKD
ncbi:TerD family protein [Methylobacterium oryzihabitans]|uniref:TerD family protein n=1 Tax=Methylobacterium oryzihabitans TaxID=2499852 RepID=UPI0011D228FA|nr:TerD family protein [Methylobacterium oryzihabitans]